MSSHLEIKIFNQRNEIAGLRRSISRHSKHIERYKKEVLDRDEMIKDLESEINRLYIVFGA